MLDFIGADDVNLFRIENSFKCGGSIHDCVANEDPALIMARVALGESPSSLNDRVFVMWNIKMRAELGFKNAGEYSGPYNSFPDRWGPETTIAREALCFGGCQFEVMRASQHVYFGCDIHPTSYQRMMFCPLDESLVDFQVTYLLAQEILERPLTDMPVELWGYDGFRSQSISWFGRIDYPGGLQSRQFFNYGSNVWRDEYPKDNVFWDQVRQGIPTRTPIPNPTLEATAIATRAPTPTPAPTLTPTPESARLQAVNPDAQPTQLEAIKMELDPGKITLLTSIGVAVIWFLTVIYTGVFKRPKPPENVLKGIVFVGSVTLAYFWGDAMIPALVLPPIADGLFTYAYTLLEWVTALLAVSVLIFKFAQQIFDRLWQPLMGWFGERAGTLTFLRP
ncbi:MAG: hypothetical protein KAT00_13055 [Planctomycetes bacterium]|nr:hypothetical protein [Planctomycetota bacterium]